MSNEPEKKQVEFQVWNLETDEIETLTMDEDDYNDMVEYEKQYEKEREERRKRRREEEHRLMRYDRDD